MKDEVNMKAAVKPHIERVVMPDGTVRLLGVAAAARYLGCTQQAVGQLIRGRTPGYALGGPLEKRMRELWPELMPVNTTEHQRREAACGDAAGSTSDSTKGVTK